MNDIDLVSWIISTDSVWTCVRRAGEVLTVSRDVSQEPAGLRDTLTSAGRSSDISSDRSMRSEMWNESVRRVRGPEVKSGRALTVSSVSSTGQRRSPDKRHVLTPQQVCVCFAFITRYRAPPAGDCSEQPPAASWELDCLDPVGSDSQT